MIRVNKYKTAVKTRSDLLSLLSEACEIEHGLACSYLYSAFSLKQEIDEGLTATELHSVRKWASNIFFIASQEMLHLSQAWNLLIAIGGSPYYFRPNFPQSSKYYPINVPLKLEPFSENALRRFLLYELPRGVDEKKFLLESFGEESGYTYKTVGELYELIRSGFENIPELILFIGDPQMQVGQQEIDFREIIKITNRETAFAAIDMITEQGEGNEGDISDSHFGLFLRVLEEYRQFKKERPAFEPARDIITNPIAYYKGNYGAGEGEMITHNFTKNLSDSFDDIYNLMLRALQYCFGNNNADKTLNRIFASFAINIMIRVIKPLGELLTQMPAHDRYSDKKAGASFGLTRHIPLPDNNSVAKLLLSERCKEIIFDMRELLICAPIGKEKLEAVINQLEDITAQYKG